MPNTPNEKPKRPLFLKGLIVFGIGFLANAVFLLLSIGGLLRELSRLMVIIGMALAVIGLFIKRK